MDQELLVLLPDQSLTFSSSDHIKYKILNHVIQSTADIVIIDGRFVRTIDATVAKVIANSETSWSHIAMSFHISA